MTDNGDSMEQGELGMERNRGPTAAQIARTHKLAGRFERWREEIDELLKLQKLAAVAFASRAVDDFDGISRVFDLVLPRDPVQMQRIARAIEIDPTTLQRLRSSTVDPMEIPPRAMAALSRSMMIDFATFWKLIQRDHDRLTSSTLSLSRSGARSTDVALQEFRDAWEIDEQDDPPSAVHR